MRELDEKLKFSEMVKIAKEFAENLIIPPGILGAIDLNSCTENFEKDEFLEEYIGNGKIEIKAE